MQGVCCLWQQDAWPQQGNYASSRWLPGEVVLDTYAIPLETSDGYTLEIGLYITETGQRLQVAQPNALPSDAILLPWPR